MPKKLILLTIFCLPLYLVKITLGTFTLNLLDILALLSVLTFSCSNPTFFKDLFKQNKPFFLFVGLLFSGLLLSFLLNAPSLSGLGIIASWFILPFAFAFIALQTFNTPRDKHLLLISFYLSVCLVTLIALGYKLTGSLTYDGRLNAFWSSANYLAMFLAPGIFTGLYLLHKALTQKPVRKLLLYLLSSSLCLLLLVLFFTYSYATWLAILLALTMILFSSKRFWQFKPFIFGLASLVLFFALLLGSQLTNPKLQSWLERSPRSSLASRQMIWQASFKILADHPLWGIGPGNFQKTYLNYQQFFPPYLEWAVPQPHNLYLAFWLQTGILGLLGFCGILFLIIQELFLLTKNKNSTLAWILLGYFLYLILHGLIDTPYWKNDLAYIFWLFTFLALTQNKPPFNSAKN